MQHLIDIHQLSQEEAERLIHRALYFKQTDDYPKYPFYSLANLFYENSTRTRVSFELAAKHLDMDVININLQASSETKGEVIEDTFQTIKAMGVKYFIIRHQQSGLPGLLAKKYGHDVHIINAGDGQHAHPSQALLDMMTIVENKPDLSQLKIALVGNLRHSRVANSFQVICKLMGIGELVMVAPKIWQPDYLHYGRITTSLEDGLSQADVVMCLRVQKERLQEDEQLDLGSYHQQYALTTESLAFAKPDAIVMHPGPLNRGVEIDDDVANGQQSVILQQVNNGVFMRIAILDELAN